MGRASFEYDEVGNTFYYVLVSFYAIILIPLTYIFFPTGKADEVKVDERECQCAGCAEKRRQKEANRPWRRTKKIITYLVLFIAWAIFALIVKKVTEIETTHTEYDPYSILGLDQGASSSEIKKAYRELVKVHHPDKGGDAEFFDKIAKAHQALTDDESRENWEKYGNPDGPTATTFGIALPKWLVSKEYGVWVLAFYGLIFMVVLPVAVGIWWYNSIKYNVDKVLLDTTQLFYYFLNKTPKMEVNRQLMVLAGSFEFCKQYNKDIVERETDDVELPRLMKHLPNLGENKKERPLSHPYALKARILIHAHLSRIPLESDALQFDQRYILSRVIRLIEEMISMSQQITFYTQTKIPLDTIENLLRLQPMFVQALWPKHSPLLQLPHIAESNLIHLRKNRVYSCGDLAAMDGEKRRAVLKSLSDQQYRDVLVVLTSMPRISISTNVVVEGEDDAHEVSAGCWVTVKVHLTRIGLLDPNTAGIVDQRLRLGEDTGDENSDVSENEDEKADEEKNEAEETKPKKKVWEKTRPKKKGAAKKKGGQQKQAPKKAVVSVTAAAAEEKKDDGKEDDKKDKDEDDEHVDESGTSSEVDGGAPAGSGNDTDAEEEWENPATKKPNFEAKSRQTHPVHCPNYPGEKYEWWWLILALNDKKFGRRPITHITPCKTLLDEQTVELRFAAPDQKGTYNLSLSVRSDSYMDQDYSHSIKLEVKEAKVIVAPKYEDTEDEEEKAACSSDEEYTEGSDSDDE